MLTPRSAWGSQDSDPLAQAEGVSPDPSRGPRVSNLTSSVFWCVTMVKAKISREQNHSVIKQMLSLRDTKQRGEMRRRNSAHGGGCVQRPW